MRKIIIVLLTLTLSACASRRGIELPDLSVWDDRYAVLSGVDDFDFRGRIAVNTGDDGFNGKLRWEQRSTAFEATVSGPLGIGTVRIEGDGKSARITDKDGETTELHDVEPELYYRYGWTIPIESLHYWALGVPDPRVPSEWQTNDSGELSQLTQRGWNVTISRYREAGGGQRMPRLLTASNSETRVRLVVDRWTFYDAGSVAVDPES